VIVAASDQESAFRIFSVLNSRGLDLSPADILEAEIIGALPIDKQDDYTGIWEDIEDELGEVAVRRAFRSHPDDPSQAEDARHADRRVPGIRGEPGRSLQTSSTRSFRPTPKRMSRSPTRALQVLSMQTRSTAS
jgi:hypothetical protein